MIRCSGVWLVLGGKQLFDDLSIAVPRGAKLGIVGDNGAGKTTLFRMIAGDVPPDRGVVSIPAGSRIGHLPQDLVEIGEAPLISFLKERAGIADIEKDLAEVRDRLSRQSADIREKTPLLARHERALHAYESRDGYGFEAVAGRILKGLGFRQGDQMRSCAEFSGGWKMRVFLASLLLCKPDILLLDEPTNHLDTESMEWLEGYLASFPGTLMAISHDRRFLDKLTKRTAELSGGKIRVYTGNFSEFIEKRAQELEIAEKTRKKQDREIAKTQAFIERFRYKASKASLVQSRVRSLEKISRSESESGNRRVSIRFPKCPRSGLEVISAEGLGHSYGDNPVFSGIDLTIRRGERVALVGINGAGKSTLTRLLNLGETPSAGSVTLGHNVRSAFFSQESAKNLYYGHSVWDEIRNTPSICDEPQRRNLLGCFLFSGSDIEKPVRVLSGGEKSRLALLKILLQETNLLILDEPTNHLDMATKELFQESLLGYGGTIVIVSHDRDFLDALVDRVIEIREGSIFDYPGNYSYFIEKRAESLSAAGAGRNGNGSGDEGSLKGKKRIEAERRNRLYREKKKFLDELKPLEERIEQAEKRMSDIDLSLADPATHRDPDSVREMIIERAELGKETRAMMQRWEKLMDAVAETENECG